MKITPQQAHVLENLNRVVPLPSKSYRARYQLDGVECTAQITGLTVKKLIAKHANGCFTRLLGATRKVTAIGQRQPPLASSLEMIRASLAAPVTARTMDSAGT